MILQTERLLLRELAMEDVAALNEIESNPRVTRYLPFEPQSPEDTRGYVEAAIRDQSQHPRRSVDLAIVPRALSGAAGSDKLIGRCGLGIRRPEHREAALWYILHPGHWGRGFASEAAARLLDFGFGELGLHRVFADCDPRNVVSCRVAERLGMKFEGRLRENYWLKGEWCDTALYAMLADEWDGRRRAEKLQAGMQP